MTKQKLSHPKYLECVADLDTLFKESEELIHDARNQLKSLQFQGETLIVKSFKVPHLLNKIVYSFFRQSKAEKSYVFAEKIGKFTAEAIAYVECSRYGLISNSYFIAKHYEFDFDIRRPLLELDFADRALIFKSFAAFVYQLHQHNILHLDLSPGNILIKRDETGQYQFKIVDINRMKFIFLSEKTRASNFSKLWANNDDLTVMLSEYAKLAAYEQDRFILRGLQANQRNKNIKNFKKRLKGHFVND
jgi:serine/threonine protein kinase